MNWKEIAPPTFIYDSKGMWIRNWFSNMIVEPVIIDGIIWKSVENYYQAMKCDNIKDHSKFINCSPSKAKFMGKSIKIRTDWEHIKVDIMKKALICKFMNNQENRKKLLKTQDTIIVEWNNWGDTFWRVDIRSYKGQNMLGNLLMQIRSEIRSRL